MKVVLTKIFSDSNDLSANKYSKFVKKNRLIGFAVVEERALWQRKVDVFQDKDFDANTEILYNIHVTCVFLWQHNLLLIAFKTTTLTQIFQFTAAHKQNRDWRVRCKPREISCYFLRHTLGTHYLYNTQQI